MKLVFAPFVLVLTAFPLSAVQAQSTKVLRGGQITEAAVLEALTPEVRTRSIRPSKPASASMLITFETNSSQLTSEARQSLDVVSNALNDNKLADFKFIIEGHADPRGTSERNRKLSEERAEAVRQYLVSQRNVPGVRLKAIGKGDTEPLNEKVPAAAENRRVTFITVKE